MKAFLLIKSVAERIQVIVIAVDDKVVFKKTNLFHLARSVIVIAVYHVVDVEKPGGRIDHDVNNGNDRKQDREEEGCNVLCLVLSDFVLADRPSCLVVSSASLQRT